MNGFRARRLALGLTMEETAKKSGLSPYTIRCCEEGDAEQIALYRLLALCKTLDITPDKGCKVMEFPGHRQRPRKREPRNILERYMACKELTLQAMAVLLDVSPQTVSVQCAKRSPAPKYVQRLAEEEDMPLLTFERLYSALPLS